LTGGDYTEKASRRDNAPRVWAIASYRAGENSQIFGLAQRVDRDFVTKRLRYNKYAGPLGILRLATLRGIDASRSDALTAPWPDVIVCAGVKNEPVCRWIARQSGGRTQLVFLGRTWARRREFGLVVTTPQYRVPSEPNVVHNLMTQHGVVPERLAAERDRWEARFEGLPRPLLGVLIGGDSGPFVLGERAARRLARKIDSMVAERGGSAIVTTSARTRPVVADVLEAEVSAPMRVHRFRAGDPNNPYFGILAHAAAFVVTSDSVAMLSEAAATGRDVHIFDLGAHGRDGRDVTVKSIAYRTMMALLPQRLSRDIGLFHAQFVAHGYGTWSNEPCGARDGSAADEAERTVARVRALTVDRTN
jgi:mitochondrial fission protein ELM1